MVLMSNRRRFVNANNSAGCYDKYAYIKDLIDRLFLIFFVRFLFGVNRFYVRLSLSLEFEQFRSLHIYSICAPRKDIVRSGI